MEQFKNQELWNKRAEEFKTDKEATFPDIYLREKEIQTIIKYIKGFKHDSIIDAGCGNGYSTIKYAEYFPDSQVTGFDISENMIKFAKKACNKVNFRTMDILKIEFEDNNFDILTTCRVLINLGSFEKQIEAMREMHRVLKMGGIYIMLESTVQSYNNLNVMRAKYGLTQLVPNKANIYIDSDKILEKVKNLFEVLVIDNFSSTYYLGSRIAYPMMLDKKEEPKHNHIVNKFFSEIDSVGDFGRERIYLLRKK